MTILLTVTILSAGFITSSAYAQFRDVDEVEVDVQGDGKDEYEFGVDFTVRVNDDLSSIVDFQANEDDKIKLEEKDKIKVEFDLDHAEEAVAAFLVKGKALLFEDVEPDRDDWIDLYHDGRPTDDDFRTTIPDNLDDGNYQFIVSTIAEGEDNFYYFISDAEID